MARLFYETVRTINPRDYSPQQIEAWAPRVYTPQEWRVRQAGKSVVVAVVDGAIAGFAELDPDGHIDCFYAHKDHQRRGVGSRLLAELESMAGGLALRRLFADVSLTAMPFFERKGFRAVRDNEINVRGVMLRNVRMEKNLA